MAEISPTQGPQGPKEDPHKRDLKKMGTPEKFKETYRVQAIGEADAETKKKRKRQEEAPEEIPNPDAAAPAPQKTGLEPSPFEVQKPGSTVASTSKTSAEAPPSGSYYMPSSASAQSGSDAESLPTPAMPSEPPAASAEQQAAGQGPPTAAQAPSSEQPPAVNFSEDDLFTDDDEQEPYQEVYEEGQTPTMSYDTSQPAPQQPPTTVATDKTSSEQTTPQQALPPQAMIESEKAAPKRSLEKGKGEAKEEPLSKLPAPMVEKKPLSPSSETKNKDTKAPSSEENSSILDQKTPPTAAPIAEKDKAEMPSPLPLQAFEENEMLPPPPAALPQPKAATKESSGKDLTAEEIGLSWQEEATAVKGASSESSKQDSGEHKQKKEDETISQTPSTPTDVTTPFALQGTMGSSEPMPTYTSFSPALLEMFDKMVGTISVLQESSGQRMTTITLTSENFSSSPFYGAQIVIEEDLHLAPGQYNIKLVGSPEATALFQAKSDDLLAAFQSGNYNFKVQRIETAIQSVEKPLFHRKEKAGGEAGADTGGEGKG